ncbi:MAG: arginine--tRNA ligase [Geminicoccaceae bacterium]|nr:MAG: arginine--tRNA ligase [Geminicoccaceae bacterium]
MNLFSLLEDRVRVALGALQAAGVLPHEVPLDRWTVEPPRDPSHGDAATNAALVLAKPARLKPLVIAEALAAELAKAEGIAAASVAAPGFVNLRLADALLHDVLRAALDQGADFGRAHWGRGQRVNVEFCSANPTGPLHVGHGRGTVYGDALAAVLEAVGFEVTREYYVNDGGAQIETLARSVHHRYREALGEAVGPVPEGCYPGDYLIPVGRALAEHAGGRYQDQPESVWLGPIGDEAKRAMLLVIKEDLRRLKVAFDVFTHEADLIAQGAVEACIAELQRRDLVYTGTLAPPKGKPIEDWEPRPQLLFRATQFGDDVDRPLQRSTGDWTYFANDIANHFDKYRRGFTELVDVWGADHGGYVKRMQAGVEAVTGGAAKLEVKLCQLVQLMDGGQPLKMSKRAGRIVTLRDVIDEVGPDVFRFIMLTRKNDATLDFDLQKVLEQSKDNPVFYVQYAHARICSVFRNAEAEGVATAALDGAELERLNDEGETALVRAIALFPRMLDLAARHREPHRIAFYLEELAGAVHRLWTRGKEDPRLRFLVADDPGLSRARLALLAGARHVLAGGLELLGVDPVDAMH